MRTSSDQVINSLIKKKKELLNQLVRQSIQFVIEEQTNDRMLTIRLEILAGLQRNDTAIKTREQQTGIDAMKQEPKLFREIGSIMHTIEENNKQAISKNSRKKKEIEFEKFNLEKENKVSGYIHQTKSYNSLKPFGSGSPKKQNSQHLLKGVL